MKTKQDWDNYLEENGSDYRVYHKDYRKYHKSWITIGIIGFLVIIANLSLFTYAIYNGSFDELIKPVFNNRFENNYTTLNEFDNQFENEINNQYTHEIINNHTIYNNIIVEGCVE